MSGHSGVCPDKLSRHLHKVIVNTAHIHTYIHTYKLIMSKAYTGFHLEKWAREQNNTYQKWRGGGG